MTQYLFDSRGPFVGFRRSPGDRYVFDPNGDWLGWLPFHDDTVVTPDGDYLASILGRRLLVLPNQPYRGYPGPGYPGYPGYAGPVTLPTGAHDLPASARTRFQHLFNSGGAWVAFRFERNVFDTSCS